MNLSETQTRGLVQPDKLARRASILPEQRNTKAPALEINATMTSARRGDVGGADALLRTLGLVERAGRNVVDVAQARHAEAEQANIARGAVDQQANHVDPEMERKSLGYRNAVTKGRTMTEFNAATRDFDVELRGMIETDNDPHLEVRQERVRSRVEEFYANFAIDPETKQLRPFLQSPVAMRYLAEGIAVSRPQIEKAALERIELRFRGEARGHFAQNLDDQIDGTRTLDVAEALSILPDTVPIEEIRATFVQGMANAATAVWTRKGSVDGLRVIDAVLADQPPAGALRPDATSVAQALPAAAPVRGRSSLPPGDAVVPDPDFDLPRPLEDPVTAYERTRDIPKVTGVERLKLTAENRLALRETRQALATRIRREWREKVEEEQGFNATGMALRLYGQGPVLTSVQISEAIEQGRISPDAGIALFGLLRRNASEAQQYADRRQALADRAEHKADADTTERAVGRYISDLTTGRVSPAQARERVMRELGRYKPGVAVSILNGVLDVAGDVETSALNGAGVRGVVGAFEGDLRDAWRGAFSRLEYGLNGVKQAHLTRQSDAIIDQMQADFLRRVQQGATPEAAKAATLNRFGPRLQALLPRPTNP